MIAKNSCGILRIKRVAFAFLITIAVFIAACIPALASVASDSYIYDAWGTSVPAPNAFVQTKTVTGENLGTAAFANPQDLFSDGKNIYIADTDNNRIVVMDNTYHFISQITDIKSPSDGITQLKSPNGVFVDQNGYIYICDTGNGRVVKLDKSNQCLLVLSKPKSDLFTSDMQFKPLKVVVNQAGNILVVAYGIYMGFVNFDPSGTFLGFFGGNRVDVTPALIAHQFWKKIFTESQNQYSTRALPIEYSNAYIQDGLIYAVVKQSLTSTDQLKKLNACGQNVLQYQKQGQLYPPNEFGDIEKVYVNGALEDNIFTAVDVNDSGNIALLDSNKGHIFIYDKTCKLLFIFGNDSGQTLLTAPNDVIHNGDDYLVLDSGAHNIKVFSPTAYATQVLKAMEDYHNSRYVQAGEVAKSILKEYANSQIACQCLGMAAMQNKNYGQACSYFKQANDRTDYSVAFREYRKEYVSQHFLQIVIGAVLIMAGFYWAVRLFKKWMGYERVTHKVRFK